MVSRKHYRFSKKSESSFVAKPLITFTNIFPFLRTVSLLRIMVSLLVVGRIIFLVVATFFVGFMFLFLGIVLRTVVWLLLGLALRHLGVGVYLLLPFNMCFGKFILFVDGLGGRIILLASVI